MPIKSISDLLYKAGCMQVSGTSGIQVNHICFDSTQCKPGSLFIAVKGSKTDGHDFINQAVAKGSIAVVCEQMPVKIKSNVTYVKVADSKMALGIIASNFYDCPSTLLKLVGITGTNGKTTVATLLYQLFRSIGYKCGLISTVRNCINDRILASTHTTPDAIHLNELLADMANEGCEYCFMEVSSHAIEQKRIAGLEYKGGVFTNITHDHLDYHKTFDAYLAVKKKFFDDLGSGAFALANKDDRNSSFMVQNTKASKKTYALKNIADFHGKVMENLFTGLHLTIGGNEVWTRLIGEFNASNLLAAYSTAILLGQSKSKVLTVLSGLNPAEGRFQPIRNKQGTTGIIDYAHTPDALQHVLETIHAIREPEQNIITVVGCGGNRDVSKRPIMGKIASEESDKVIFTSDNPRSEDPLKIIEEMVKGVSKNNKKKILVISDRREAIKTACWMAHDKDIVLLAGKGHEKYQELKGKKFPFDDLGVLKEIWKQENKEIKNLPAKGGSASGG